MLPSRISVFKELATILTYDDATAAIAPSIIIPTPVTPAPLPRVPTPEEKTTDPNSDWTVVTHKKKQQLS